MPRLIHTTPVSALAVMLWSSSAIAQVDAQAGAQTGARLEEVVVVAQKREQSANEVGMSISAVSAAALQSQGIQSTEDLVKVIPAFTVSQTAYGAPVYTLRGVGVIESSLAATPAVSVYVDEAPLPFPLLTQGGALDVERVEVLKGPQGTLFGQNATGGAINYIAAKPTDTFHAGINASYGRFNAAIAEGFISGPITDTLRARLALKTRQGGEWQRSYTRNDELGDRDEIQGRLLVEWEPTDRLNFMLNLNGWVDRSDTMAGQLIGTRRTSLVAPVRPLEGYPFAPQDARAADWNPTPSLERNNQLRQIALRSTFDLSDSLRIVSISSYTRFKMDYVQDADASALQVAQFKQLGSTETFSQELRLEGDIGDRGNYLVGLYYQDDEIEQATIAGYNQSTLNTALPGRFFPGNIVVSADDIRTVAVFGNFDYELTPTLSAVAGIRYTEVDHKYEGCVQTDQAPVAAFFSGREAALKGGVNLVGVAQPIGCFTFLQNLSPGLHRTSLQEDNVSWRLGLNWKPVDGTLLYGLVSRGYKAAVFPSLGATSYVQYAPAVQEELTAYELGVKSTLLDRRLQFNAAVFYNDYKNKQLRGRIIDPLGIFGALEALVNVPESRVIGAETQITWLPFEGMTINASATYVDSEVTKSFINFDGFGNSLDFKGLSYPLSPEWSATFDAEYRRPIGSVDGFAGLSGDYQSSTQAQFTRTKSFDIKARTLLDARLGVAAQDDQWRAWAWVRNLTDEYYWTSAGIGIDAITRYAGMPRTYGVSLSYRY